MRRSALKMRWAAIYSTCALVVSARRWSSTIRRTLEHHWGFPRIRGVGVSATKRERWRDEISRSVRLDDRGARGVGRGTGRRPRRRGDRRPGPGRACEAELLRPASPLAQPGLRRADPAPDRLEAREAQAPHGESAAFQAFQIASTGESRLRSGRARRAYCAGFFQLTVSPTRTPSFAASPPFSSSTALTGVSELSIASDMGCARSMIFATRPSARMNSMSSSM